MIVIKLRVFCMALFAVLAVGVSAASVAYAEEAGPEWLVEGAAVTEGLLSETVGSILLVRREDATLGGILNEIECSGIFLGLIGFGAAVGGNLDLIEELYNLSSEKIELLNEAKALLCEVQTDKGSLEDCEVGAALALVWAENLPWETELELMTVGGKEDVLDKLLGPDTAHEPAYDIECKILLGIEASELCESLPGQASVLLENEPNGVPASVLGWFLPEADEELANCGGMEHVGEVVSDVSGDTWAVTALLGTKLATAISGG